MSAGVSTDKIQEHMEVVCNQGVALGKVDHVMGEQIKLTKNDSPDGKHHTIPTSLVARVDDKVHLSKSGAEVKQMWGTED